VPESDSHWWMVLPALPPELGGENYKRLRKIWADKTRFRGTGKNRKHEFVTREWETHLMTTLWENFVLFSPRDWLHSLSTASGIGLDHTNTRACNWSYGFRERSTRKIADIVIGFDGVEGGLGCYVIETKRPGEKLTIEDLDPAYYLNIEHIATHATCRKLIYCVDAKEKARIKSVLSSETEKYQDCGVLTWAEVAGIQINLANQLDLAINIRSFIAGSIQYQFCQHGIVPSVLSHEYLAGEPSILDVDSGVYTPYDNHDPQWARIGRHDDDSETSGT